MTKWRRNRNLDNGGPYVAEALASWVMEYRDGRFRYTGEKRPNGCWIVADKLGFNVLTCGTGAVFVNEAEAQALAQQWNA